MTSPLRTASFLAVSLLASTALAWADEPCLRLLDLSPTTSYVLPSPE